MKQFPTHFLWGAATSGPQSEGRFHKPNDHVFDYYYDHFPEAFYQHVGPDTASDFYHSFKEDLHLMKSIGMNSFRTSIQWTRLIDDFDKGTLNQDGVRFYNEMIDAALAENLTPIMNLHHFDLPVELYQKYGGWESKVVTDLFAQYAATCFRLFGDRVKYWTTHNEPMVVVEGQYLYQFHYPLIVDGQKAVQVAYHLNLASAKAIQAFRQLKIPDAKIGIILNLTPTYPASDAPQDLQAAHIAELWNNRLFLDPAVKGKFPEELEQLLAKDKVLWDSTPEEKELIAQNTVDFLGVNYYHPNRVKAPDIAPDSVGEWLPNRYYDEYLLPGRRVNRDRGWEIYPQALYDIALNIKENYGNLPWYVSENGMGVSNEERYMDENGVIQDDYRIDFVKEHLNWLHRGIEEGSNCFGYHMWTAIDCWSWLNAYKNRYGFISNDIHRQIKTIKKSGYWFKRVTERNGLEEE